MGDSKIASTSCFLPSLPALSHKYLLRFHSDTNIHCQKKGYSTKERGAYTAYHNTNYKNSLAGKGLTVWPLTNMVQVCFLALAHKTVCSRQVEQVGCVWYMYFGL